MDKKVALSVSGVQNYIKLLLESYFTYFAAQNQLQWQV